MSMIGLTLLRGETDSSLSPHFAKAKWLMVHDTETRQQRFRRNETLTADDVVGFFEHQGCSDVIFSAIGPGALSRLQAAGIRGWYGPGGVPAVDLPDLLETGQLELANETWASGGPVRARRRRGPRGNQPRRFHGKLDTTLGSRRRVLPGPAMRGGHR